MYPGVQVDQELRELFQLSRSLTSRSRRPHVHTHTRMKINTYDVLLPVTRHTNDLKTLPSIDFGNFITPGPMFTIVCYHARVTFQA